MKYGCHSRHSLGYAPLPAQLHLLPCLRFVRLLVLVHESDAHLEPGGANFSVQLPKRHPIIVFKELSTRQDRTVNSFFSSALAQLNP
jgi:hypothetical protein